MESTKDVSVYQNITGLCESFAVDLYNDTVGKQNVVKKLRSRAFNKLLFFKYVLQNHEEETESNVGFLVPDISLEIQSCIKKNLYHCTKVKKQNVFNMLERIQQIGEQDAGIASAMQLLLLLADTKISDNTDEIPMYGLDLRRYSNIDLSQHFKNPYSILPDSSFEFPNTLEDNLYSFIPQYKHSKIFHFTYPFEDEPGTGLSSHFSVGLHKLPGPFDKEVNEEEFDSTKWRFPPGTLEPQSQSQTSIHADEGYVTPDNDHIWEIKTCKRSIDYWDGSHLKRSSSLRTWEDLGSKDPKPERLFISQSETSIFHLWRIVRTNFIHIENFENLSSQVTEITMESLSHDIKYLLTAIESNTFYYSQVLNSFVIKEGVYIAGISPDILEQYCDEYIRCANSYYMLTKLIARDLNNQNKPKEGLIYMTLCRCVQHYIQCYRGIILRPPFSQGLLKMNHWVVNLRIQLEFLAKLCCVYPSEETVVLPHGGALLVYIYDKVTEVVRQDLAYLLYYILESCCLVYFRFLEKWIFEGVCDDPYEEFFIVARQITDVSYDRQFWTRGFVLKKLLVPGFLKGLESDLFVCGKSISLIKLSNVNDSLLQCLKQGYPRVDCCLDQEALDHVLSQCLEYEDRCVKECGSRPRVFCCLTEEEQEIYALSLTKQREKTFDKIRKAQEENKKLKSAHKREVFEELKKGMEDEKARKIEARQSKLFEDIKILETAMELEKVDNLRREEERKKLVEYYNLLSAKAEKQRSRAEWKLKRMKLNEERSEFLKKEQTQLQNEVFSLTDIPKDADNNEANLIESSAVTSGTGDFVIPNKLIHDDHKTAIISDPAGDGPGIDDSVECSNTQDGRTDLSDTKHVSFQAQLNKTKFLKEEFDKFGYKKTPVNENSHFSTYESDMFVEKRSEKAERIQKELKLLEGVMIEADEARLKGIQNREKTYGGKYNIITGECKRAGVECNIDDVVNDDESGDIREHIVESIVPSEHIEDPIETVNKISAFKPEQDENSFHELIIAINDNVDEPQKPIKLVDNFYKDIYEIDKRPIIIDIADNIPYVGKKKRKINVQQVDFTRIYNCLQKSVLFPLQIQLRLVNDAILRLFINEHNLIAHLDCIRKYFFLLDGDYGCNLTNHLFAEMQSVKRPSLLLNHVRLNSLLRTAVGNNSDEDIAERLSFLVNNVPTSFHLTDPNALDCLSMTYRTHWPLNVIITPQAISKYDKAFNFLMQLRRASWALEQDIYLLKVTHTTTSSQYRQVQLFRHIMAQFLQALQNYVMTTVMEHSWLELKTDLDKATTLEALYMTHVNYVKKVIFRCLLGKRSKNIHKHLLNLFRIILTFHENLRSDIWTENHKGEFQHPAFSRLCHQYGQFLELSRFLFSYLERLVTSGYQPHLEQLLMLLSCNNFYKI